MLFFFYPNQGFGTLKDKPTQVGRATNPGIYHRIVKLGDKQHCHPTKQPLVVLPFHFINTMIQSLDLKVAKARFAAVLWALGITILPFDCPLYVSVILPFLLLGYLTIFIGLNLLDIF